MTKANRVEDVFASKEHPMGLGFAASFLFWLRGGSLGMRNGRCAWHRAHLKGKSWQEKL